MELDDLKKQLNLKISSAQQQRSADDISSLLKKQMASTIQKLKRNLLLEMILCLVFTIASFIMILLVDQWRYNTYFIVASAAGSIVCIIMFFLIQKIEKLSASLSIRQNIEGIISIIYRYAWLYMRIGIGLLPLCFGFVFWMSYNDPIAVPKPIRWDVFGYLLITMLLFSYASFRFTKWYLRRLYGNYVEQLETILQEFKEDEGI